MEILFFITVIVILGFFVWIVWKIYKDITFLPRKNPNFSERFNSAAGQTTTMINSSINKARKSIEKSVSKSYITGCTWIQTNEDIENVLYTFRNNDELLITINGNVIRAKYELIVDNNSMLITKNNNTEHFNIVNIHNDFLFLNKVTSTQIIALANHTKYKDELKSQLNNKAKQLYNF